MIYDFKFGEKWLSEDGLAVCASVPDREIAQRDFSLVEIPGHDGSDCVDNGCYKNVVFSREIGLVAKNGARASEKAEQLIRRFAYLYGYRDFEENSREGFVTKAVLTNFPSVIRSLRTLRRATLEFSRLPYWYLKTGLEFTVFSGSVTLINPLPSNAKPRFVFKLNPSGGTVRATLTVNGVAVLSNKLINCDSTHDILEIDSEREQAFVRSAGGEILRFIDMSFPVLPTGESTIAASGANITEIGVAPRWREL